MFVYRLSNAVYVFTWSASKQFNLTITRTMRGSRLWNTLFAKLPQFAFSEETVATAWRGAGPLQSCSTAALQHFYLTVVTPRTIAHPSVGKVYQSVQSHTNQIRRDENEKNTDTDYMNVDLELLSLSLTGLELLSLIKSRLALQQWWWYL